MHMVRIVRIMGCGGQRAYQCPEPGRPGQRRAMESITFLMDRNERLGVGSVAYNWGAPHVCGVA